MSPSSSVHLTTLFPERLHGHLGYLKINYFCLFGFEVLCPSHHQFTLPHFFLGGYLVI